MDRELFEQITNEQKAFDFMRTMAPPQPFQRVRTVPSQKPIKPSDFRGMKQ